MKKILALSIFVLLLLSMSLAFADEGHQSGLEEGKKLVESKISCDELSDDQFEAIGDYFMEQMHPGEAHEMMDQMMGGEGSERLRQMHVMMAKNLYCNENIDGMMGSGGMMGMMNMMNGGGMMGADNMMSSGGMMNRMGGQIPQTSMMQGRLGCFGVGFSSWNFFGVLYPILLIGLIVLVYLWIIKLCRGFYGNKK